VLSYSLRGPSRASDIKDSIPQLSHEAAEVGDFDPVYDRFEVKNQTPSHQGAVSALPLKADME